jgi:hypothetical protein
VGKKTLVALDTNHIKQYVFATDRLKEIRGASSILDHLNRHTMEEVALSFKSDFSMEQVYANGGSGLFLVNDDEKHAEEFGRAVQQKYREITRGGASITFAVQPLPDDRDPWHGDIQSWLHLLNYRLVMAKMCPVETTALPSHPFLRPCSACGVQYAEEKDNSGDADPGEQDKRFCRVCIKKRTEDDKIKQDIQHSLFRKRTHPDQDDNSLSYIWEKIIHNLPDNYDLPANVERPSDFNKLRGPAGGKDYLALIYADGNSMGQIMDKLKNLQERQDVAELIDNSIFKALGKAIFQYLPVIPAVGKEAPMFPFDILMIGGDDLMLVTRATDAFDVARTVAKEFYDLTKAGSKNGEEYSLSVSVIIAPIKYPFGLLQDMASDALKHAKKEGARNYPQTPDKYGDTYINFLVVAGGGNNEFKAVMDLLRSKSTKNIEGSKKFYATMRPYTAEGFDSLLATIRDGKRLGLGRTKLHQLREAVLKMNLTTSVGEAAAVMRNWKKEQEQFARKKIYTLDDYHRPRPDNNDSTRWRFIRPTFPWLPFENRIYRTSVLDFVEIYDFVTLPAEEGGDRGKQH